MNTTTQKEPTLDDKPKPKNLDAYYDMPDERADNYTADYFPPY